jgi:hypothetical protein
MSYKQIGNTQIEWQDDEPLIWTMSEEFGAEGQRETRYERFDWTKLREIVDDPLLLLLKEDLIERRHNIAIRSIKAESTLWRNLFLKIQKHKCYQKKVTQFDWQFIATLQTLHKQISRGSIDVLRS